MVSGRNRQRNFGLLLAIALSMHACAHEHSVPETADASATSASQAPQPPTDIELARQQISKLQDRVQDLEVRLSAMNDKINLENGSGAPSALNLPTEAVEAPAAHAKVVPAKRPERKSKTVFAGVEEKSNSSSEAVDRFREAKILFDSKRYSDSMLEFSEFVKNEPDHPLAAAAQYFVGMSYLKQNEYKLAEEELSRGLISYAHSSYIPDTLLALSQVSQDLKKPTKVIYYREKLLSHFPNSPQAKNLNEGAAPAENESLNPPATELPKEVVRENSKQPEPQTPTTVTTAKVMESNEGPSVVNRPEAPTVAVPAVESESP
jgi:TolA-binding protein